MNATYQATQKLQLNAGITYNLAESSWEWEFGDRDILAGAGGTYYDTAEQNNLIDSYSDLSYTEVLYTLGGTYNFTQSFHTSAQLTYDVFDSDEEYVYGDESGEVLTGYVGLGWTF